MQSKPFENLNCFNLPKIENRTSEQKIVLKKKTGQNCKIKYDNFGDFQTLCKSYLINLPVTILMTVCNVIRRKDAKPKVEKVVPLGQKLPLLLRDASLNSISDFAPDFVASSKATSIF